MIGCGYLGMQVASRLRAGGAEVCATTRKPARAERFAALGLTPVPFDVLSPAALPEADAVVHAVGFDRASGESMRRVYVQGLANVLAALPGRPRFVHVSSTSVYGQRDGGWVDESAATEPADESGRVVLDAERLLRERRPDAVVLRFAGIYGPGRLMRAASLRAGEPVPADPAGWLNLIHVEDGAAIVAAAVAGVEAGSTLNVSDGSPVRRGDFYAELARLLGAPPPRFVAGGEAADRRIDAGRLRAALGLRAKYEDYRAGLAASAG